MSKDTARGGQTFICFDCLLATDNGDICPYCGSTNIAPIDNLMVAPIIKLNMKGYKTVMCCEGHEDEQGFESYKEIFPHIFFAENYSGLERLGGNIKKIGAFYRVDWGYRVPTKTKAEKGRDWLKELRDYKYELMERINYVIDELPTLV